jgi:CTP:molybdopterin cytidylyltransferase MocA
MSAGPNRFQVAAIVLAAGRSTRMAPDNKLLQVIDGAPVVRHVVSAALASGAHPIIVVTGFPEAIGAEERERLPRAGVVQVLSKEAVHLDPSVLVKALDQVFVHAGRREDRS